ncbi:MAG: MarR family transcriptional regulator [Hamadaea sp.]|nr:MarR family transcriptional regulator [Hamadaea sp.]
MSSADRQIRSAVPGVTAEEAEFEQLMRRQAVMSMALGQAAAEVVGLNATQLNCLNLIALDGPLTAGQVAAGIGLTTASTTAILDKLETEGHIVRERDPQDRRRVTVSINMGKGLEEISPLFAPLTLARTRLLGSHSPEETELILEFVRKNTQLLAEAVERLRAMSPRRKSS